MGWWEKAAVQEMGGEREGWWGSKVMGERHSLGNRGGGGEGQGESGREGRWERGGGEGCWGRTAMGEKGGGEEGQWVWGEVGVGKWGEW